MMSPDILLAYLESTAVDERRSGLIFVARYNLKEFLGDVLRLLCDCDATVRSQAANTLQALGHPAAIEALADTLYDCSNTVRVSAARALVQFGARVIPHVRDVLQSDYKDARVSAFQVLSRLDCEEARAVIRQYWNRGK